MKIIYVNDNNQTTIICAKCGFEKNIRLPELKNTHRRLKVKCKCGELHGFTIEFRKTYRKHVKLPGEYSLQGNGQKGEIIIRDLSLTGIRFESLRPHQIMKDDMFEVKFKLDNPSKKEIRKLAKVVWVKERIVGSQFSEKKFYESDLGFYLKR